MAFEQAIFRVDASDKIGTGHLARSTQLATYLKQTFNTHVTWIGTLETFQHVMNRQATNRVIDQFVSVGDISGEDNQCKAMTVAAEYLPEYGAEKPLYFQDGMHMDQRSLKAGRELGLVGFSTIIDERADCSVSLGDPDVLVDVLPHDPAEYTAEMISPETNLLIGPKYQMIAKHIREQRRQKPKYHVQKHHSGEKHVIMMNGGMNISALLNHLVWGITRDKRELDEKTVFHTYTMSSAKHFEPLKMAVDQAQHAGINMQLHVDETPNYAIGDLYIGAAGTSVYEMCAAGGMASILIGAGTGQDDLGEYFMDHSCGHYAGQFWAHGQNEERNQNRKMMPDIINQMHCLLSTDDIRAHFQAYAASFCDGNGAERITDHIKQCISSPIRLARH